MELKNQIMVFLLDEVLSAPEGGEPLRHMLFPNEPGVCSKCYAIGAVKLDP